MSSTTNCSKQRTVKAMINDEHHMLRLALASMERLEFTQPTAARLCSKKSLANEPGHFLMTNLSKCHMSLQTQYVQCTCK